MKLEPCPFCGSDDVEVYPFTARYVECNSCKATGPDHDQTGERWNSAPRNIHATIESTESGAMPWRLQIAARFWAHNGVAEVPDTKHDEVAEWFLSAADSLIAAYKATEAKHD